MMNLEGLILSQSNPFKKKLSEQHLKIINSVESAVKTTGMSVYLVGGTVRDILLNRSPLDLDFLIEGSSDTQYFANLIGGTILQESQFGTFKIDFEGEIVDFAFSRQESYPTPGQLPIVEKGTFRQDLHRRDFTMNSIAIAVGEDGEFSTLIDPFDGENDIREKKIKILHDKSFQDDPTRILRLFRYSGRLGFTVEDSTKNILIRDLHMLDILSPDRLRNELQLILNEDTAHLSLKEYVNYDQKMYLFDGAKINVANLIKMDDEKVKSSKFSEKLKFAILALSMPIELLDVCISKFNFQSEWLDIVDAVFELQNVRKNILEPGIRNSDLFALLNKINENVLKACLMIDGFSDVKDVILIYLNDLENLSIELSGKDLIQLGVPEGPNIGKILDELHVAKLNGIIFSLDDEKDFVRKIFNKN